MDITATTPTDGLESIGNSESVSNISDFLSLEELGITKPTQEDFVPLEEVERSKPKEDTEDPILGGLPEIKVEEGIDTSSIVLEEDNSVNTTGGALDYKAMVREFIDSGLWDGIEAFETDEGQVPFEDMDIDKETFLTLVKHNQEELKNKLTANTVTTDGISEFTQKLINIEKHGGDVQQALKAYQTIKEPLNNIDISDVKGQRAVCYLRLQQQGIVGQEAKDLIETYELKGVLEDRASNYKDQLDAAFNQWMISQEDKAIQEEQDYKASLKAYSSSLNEAFKAAKEFELSDTHRKKLVELATKETESGEFELDNLIDNHRRNPLDAAELILFLTDKESFLQKKAKVLLEQERKSTLKTINIIPKTRSGVDLESKKTRKDSDIYMSLDKLK